MVGERLTLPRSTTPDPESPTRADPAMSTLSAGTASLTGESSVSVCIGVWLLCRSGGSRAGAGPADPTPDRWRPREPMAPLGVTEWPHRLPDRATAAPRSPRHAQRARTLREMHNWMTSGRLS